MNRAMKYTQGLRGVRMGVAAESIGHPTYLSHSG